MDTAAVEAVAMAMEKAWLEAAAMGTAAVGVALLAATARRLAYCFSCT